MNKRDVRAADIAKATGISRGQMSEALSGKRGLGRSAAVKVAEFLRIPYSWLYLGEGSMDVFPAEEQNGSPPASPISSQLFQAVMLQAPKTRTAEIFRERLAKAEAAGTGIGADEIQGLRLMFDHLMAPDKNSTGSGRESG